MLALKTNNIARLTNVLPNHIQWEVLDNYSKNHFIAIGYNDDEALVSYAFNELDQIPLEHYYHFFSLLKILEESKKITEIISYGSIGSKKFNDNSDIDVFLVTDCSIEDLAVLIQKTMPDCYYEKDSIKIWNKELLIECECISSVSESVKYIPESPYIPAEKRVFLARDFDECVKELEKISQIKNDTNNQIETNKKRLYHNIRKLSKYKNDLYRFRFHCYIIEHCIIRLRAIKNGNLKHNYLPRNAINYLTAEEWKMINYSVFDDTQEYINNITPFAMKILEEI